MHRLQEMIRLHRLGRSRRQIARQLRMGRDTIRAYLAIVSAAGLLEGAASSRRPRFCGSSSRRSSAGAGHPGKRPRSSAGARRSWRCSPRARPPVRFTTTCLLSLHEPEYDGSLSAVKRMCARLVQAAGPKETDVAIPVETAPGEVAQVDFGYASKRYDPQRGILRRSWLFVMTLGHSRHMFLGLVFDQKIATWNQLHVEAFELFGGVPRVLVPDNLKAAVVRAAFGVDDEPVLNRSYRELARYYGFQVDPTPPRSPQKKGKVVRFVKGNFFATWESVDIDEDRRQLRRWNVEIAAQRRHGTTGRRPIELFEDVERDALLVLPKHRWQPVVWKKARVHRDCHVQIDGAFYSAPWKLIKQDLWVRCTTASVALHHGDEHLWTHARIGRGKRQTLEAHLPDHRRELRRRSRSYWTRRAREMGPEVERLAATIFDSDDVLMKLRKVQSIVTHLETFPEERARRAAARALHFECLDYRGIRRILSRGLDFDPLPGETPRQWSSGARYARRPSAQTLYFKEKHNGHLG